MSQVLRVLVYEGADEKLESQLSKSLAVDIHEFGGSIKLSIVEVRDEELIREIAALCLLGIKASEPDEDWNEDRKRGDW